MVEKIKANKDNVLEFMERELNKYGPDRMDVKEMGELADIVKDLAEAEKNCWEAQYYREVTEAMGKGSESSGYGGSRMGYNMGYDSGNMGGRRGYGTGSMGYHDPMMTIREALNSADPEMRAKIRSEIMNM
jgi:hypothetical protein